MMGPALYASELAFTWVWSVSEVALSLSRPGELVKDGASSRLTEDIVRRGFYVDVPERPNLQHHSGRETLVGENTYRYVATGSPAPAHRVVARLSRAKSKSRRLLVVFHCYGVPSPRLMASLFGTGDLDDTDVAYPIMNHHQSGAYRLWPGSGFVSANPARMLENLRAAVVGARILVRGLAQRGGYEDVSVLGFSIGGQLAMHVANTEQVARVLLYCPVVSVARIAKELGLMRQLHPGLMRLARRIDPSYDESILEYGDPLCQPLLVPEERIAVLVQRHDAMAPPRHIEPIRVKYPRVVWHEFEGTHLIPIGRRRIQGIVRRHMQ